MRILVIRRDNIGDLVCTTPLIAALRSHYPQAHIAALVNSYNAGVLDGNPDLDAVHVYTKLKHRLPGQSAIGILWARLRTVAALRGEPFDYVILASSSFNRHALRFARQLRRRDIVGFADGDEPGAGTIDVKVPAKPYAELHEVQVLSALARALGINDAEGPLRVFPDRARARSWQERLGIDARARPWVAVHISAREPSRQWPVEKWNDLIGRLTSSGFGVLVVWAPGPATDPRHPGDDEKAGGVLAASTADAMVRGAPTAKLEDLVAVLSLCQAFIGADGGAMHLAAGLGLPMVALFENLEWKKHRWHPWRVPYELVAPETREIADISVEQVMAGWQRLCQAKASGTHIPVPRPSAERAPG